MSRPSCILVLGLALPLAAQAAGKARGAAELQDFYAQNCARCHGADGSAVGPDGKRLKGMDFTDARAMAREKDGNLAKAILKGRKFGMEMPAYKDQLSAEEALAMVTEVLRKAQKGRAIGPQPAAR